MVCVLPAPLLHLRPATGVRACSKAPSRLWEGKARLSHTNSARGDECDGSKPRQERSDAVAEDAATHADGAISPVEWTPNTQRCGALAVKAGMMSLFDGYGARITVTVLMLDNVEVTQVKCPPKDEMTALQVGLGFKRRHRVPKSIRNHFEQVQVDVKHSVAQFAVSPAALMPVGTRITARHFVPGQYVDIQVCISIALALFKYGNKRQGCFSQGASKGQGTTGVMKRWGFKGGPASHGSSKFHRKAGSSGPLGPGRVLKGKKMAGRSGAQTVTTFNSQVLHPNIVQSSSRSDTRFCQVYKIDTQRDLVFVLGSVPGPQGSIVRVVDSRKASTKEQTEAIYDLPVPTMLAAHESPLIDTMPLTEV